MKKIKYSKSDYKYSSLPTSRKDEFKDIMKNNFNTILKNGFSIFLFALPLMAFAVFMDIFRLPMNSENFSEEQLSNMLFFWEIIRICGIFLLLFVVFISLSGVYRITKQLVYQEGISYLYEYKKGIKENHSKFLLYLLIYGFVFVATFIISNLIGGSIYFLIFSILYIVLFASIFIWKLASISTYDASLRNIGIFSRFCYAKNIWISILFGLAYMLPLMLTFFISDNNLVLIIIKYLVEILLYLFYYPILILINSLYTTSVFDKELNSSDYKDYFHKGLYLPEGDKNEK